MVQELHVLKCFSCETFQSHIVKKTNKWECKVCGAKQSIKKVYGRGSGIDCRKHTQQLNALKGEKEDQTQVDVRAYEEVAGGSLLQTDHIQPAQSSNGGFQNEVPTDPLRSSKWKRFLDEDKFVDQESCQKVQERPPINFRPNFENFTKRKRNFDISQPDIDEEHCSKSGTCDSVDDIYSDFSFSGSERYSKKTKDLIKYQDEIYKGNQNSKDNHMFDTLDGFENKNESPVFKLRKLANIREPSKVSLKWAKYLESNETENKQCFQSALGRPSPSTESCEIDRDDSSLFNLNKDSIRMLDAKSEVRGEKPKVPDVCSISTVNEQPELCLRKDQSLPVFDRNCELNDSDFLLDF